MHENLDKNSRMITSNKIKRHEKRYIVLSSKIFNIPLKNLCNSTTNDITINKSNYNRQFITVASMTWGRIYYHLQGNAVDIYIFGKTFSKQIAFQGYYGFYGLGNLCNSTHNMVYLILVSIFAWMST